MKLVTSYFLYNVDIFLRIGSFVHQNNCQTGLGTLLCLEVSDMPIISNKNCPIYHKGQIC